MQGESDGDAAVSQAAYDAALRLLITGFRTRITGATNSWFVIGGMVPEALAARAAYRTIRLAQIAVAASTTKAFYVEGVTGYSGDALHYTIAPGVRIAGANMAQAVPYAVSNTGSNVGIPTVLASPEINQISLLSGVAQPAGTFLVTPGIWSNFPTAYTYQWTSNGVAISGATSFSYTQKVNDAGNTIACVITATNATGSNTSTVIAPSPSATTYTFESDTVGNAPANVVAVVGAMAVANTGATGWTGKYVRDTASVAPAVCDVFTFSNLVPLGADQVVTWNRKSGGAAQDGFTLRCGSAAGGSYTNCSSGYLFLVKDGSASQILGLGSFGTALIAQNAVNIGTHTYFRASAIGSVLKLDYSDDGITWTNAITTTDTWNAGGPYFESNCGPIQYLNGFGAVPNGVYIDNVALQSGVATMQLITTSSTVQPSIYSGFGTSPAIAGKSPASFVITIGSGGVASTGIITLPAAGVGWSAMASDLTTPGTNVTKCTAYGTTSITLTNYNSTTGAVTAWTAGDQILVQAVPLG
jgi:hypothetical protein